MLSMPTSLPATDRNRLARKFADPTPDKQRTNQDEAAGDAAFQAQQAQRYTIQAYLHRPRQPLELGV